MVATADLTPEFLQQALQLKPSARLQLIDALLEAPETSEDDPAGAREEWKAELKRRIDGYLDGTIPTVDAEEMLDRLEREFEEKYAS